MIWGQGTAVGSGLASRNESELWPRGKPSLRGLELYHTSSDPGPPPLFPSVHLYIHPSFNSLGSSLPRPLHSAMPGSSFFLKHTKQPPTTGPLHVLFLLLGMLSLQTSQSLPPLSHPVCVKCHLLQENLNQPSLLHPSLCLPCFVLLHSSCHWIYFIFISLFNLLCLPQL